MTQPIAPEVHITISQELRLKFTKPEGAKVAIDIQGRKASITSLGIRGGRKETLFEFDLRDWPAIQDSLQRLHDSISAVEQAVKGQVK